MHPVIARVGGVIIHSYGLMLVLAFLVSVYLTKKKARTLGVNQDFVVNLSFVSLFFGILGSRILYTILHFDYYFFNPSEIIKLWHGGLSWFGGLFLGGAAAAIYIRRKRLRVLGILDLFAPFLALGQSIGRIGCLLNGCCYGRQADWGLYFPVHGAVLIPTQLFSSVILLLIFIILRARQERPHKQGNLILLYLLLYCAQRFFIEFWRAEHASAAFGLTYFQIISISICLLCAGRLFMLKRRR